MTDQIRILLLEDNPNDVELTHATLKGSGIKFELRHVSSGKEFAAALQNFMPHIVISDYSLPGYGGKAALVASKALSPDTPFIFYSGTIGEEAAIESLRMGATDYVLKDKPKRLASAIERALVDSEQRKAQKTADQRLKAQAQLLDLATDAIIVRGNDGLIHFWNSGAELIFGLPRDLAVGSRTAELMTVTSLDPFADANRKIKECGQWKGELDYRLKTGKGISVMSRWTLVKASVASPERILVIETDITEKKQLEKQLLRSQRLESVGTLASGIAHDLNNILAPILMAADMLKESASKEEGAEMLRLIQESTQKGVSMVNQLLTFVRGGEGKRVPTDPSHLIKEVTNLARNTFPKNIKVSYEIEQGLFAIYADPIQLHQVLMNLCINSKDAMPDGGRLILTAKNLSRTSISIEVTDTGTGIPEHEIDKVFDPFFTTKLEGKGTGLGLSTAIGIVKSHGGVLTVESQRGIGTTFRLTLPVMSKVTPR